MSAGLYKLYIDGLLDRLSSSGDGCFVGEICCVAPAACGDVAVMPPSLDASQKLISTAVDYSRMERYLLQPAKSVILAFHQHCGRHIHINGGGSHAGGKGSNAHRGTPF